MCRYLIVRYNVETAIAETFQEITHFLYRGLLYVYIFFLIETCTCSIVQNQFA